MVDQPASSIQVSRMERLERTMENGFSEIKTLISGLDTRLRTIETTENSCRAVSDMRLASMEKGLNDAWAKIRKQEEEIESMMPWYSAMKWFMGLVGAAIASGIIGLVTGQIHVTF
jgi:hypothetical protein